MKVSKAPEAFNPVVLTLETQGEVDLITNFLANCSTVNARKVFNTEVNDMWKAMTPYRSMHVNTTETIQFN